MATAQRGLAAPEIHHLRPFSTYSSPSRRISSWMFLASLEATSGSVMAKHERISPFSSGTSHRSFCSGVPNSDRISMFPVSGAAEFTDSGPSQLRPVISASGRVVDVRHRLGGPLGDVGEEEVPEPPPLGLVLQLLERVGVVVGVTGGAHLLGGDGLGRVHRLVHEREQAVAELGGAGAEVEVHEGPPR